MSGATGLLKYTQVLLILITTTRQYPCQCTSPKPVVHQTSEPQRIFRVLNQFQPWDVVLPNSRRNGPQHIRPWARIHRAAEFSRHGGRGDRPSEVQDLLHGLLCLPQRVLRTRRKGQQQESPTLVCGGRLASQTKQLNLIKPSRIR